MKGFNKAKPLLSIFVFKTIRVEISAGLLGTPFARRADGRL
jgi:hypothetical protein